MNGPERRIISSVYVGVVIIKMASQEEELNKPIAETTKEDLSYDLLENDDSDEFESIDPPQLNDEDEGRTVLPVGRRRRNLQTKTSPSPQTTKQERTLTDDIAHVCRLDVAHKMQWDLFNVDTPLVTNGDKLYSKGEPYP
jgi:hypothetical protein